MAAETTTTTTPASVMVVGIEDSEHSFYALQWTLLHFFSGGGAAPPFKLVVIHAKPSPASVVSLAGAAVSVDVVPYVESDLKKITARVLQKAKDLCAENSVFLSLLSFTRISLVGGILVSDVVLEAVEGDARNVLCEAVEKHQADMLVVGSHGYGAIKRAVLGSVSDYCAHHAHCSVMIVKKPKHKH